MKKYDYEELRMILAIYYFKKNLNNKNIENISKQLSNYFKKDFSTNDVIYCLTKIKSIDPSYKQSTLINKNSDEWKLWNYYVISDRLKELKDILYSLKNQSIKNEESSTNEFVTKNFKKMKFTFKGDVKKELYPKENNKLENSVVPTRDPQVIFNALKLANFKCEYEATHKTFIRKNSLGTPYTEGHHLIPLKFQNKFHFNLDIEANVISLCSNCHNQLHYGKDIDGILATLFKSREKRLEKCGIKISLNELKKMYL